LNQLSIYPPTLHGDDIAQKRKEILEYFYNTCSLFEKVFDVLKDESVFYKKSEKTRYPMIFYFGHTATFFINKLINMKIIKERINPTFESIFAVGVDEMEWDDMDATHYKWPKVTEVRIYREKVKKLVSELIFNLPCTLPIQDNSSLWIILMGIEHERIHIETSLVLHRQMPIDFVKESSYFPLCTESTVAPENKMVKVAASSVKIGKEREHHLYGWDNEYGVFRDDVPAFEVSKYLVSNAEFMEFVTDGGYENLEYWDEEGREFLQESGAKKPIFWVKNGNSYDYRALSVITPMPLDWPVEVNALEAEAFCRYKSKKDNYSYLLPSESEHRAIYDSTDLEDLPHLHQSRANVNFYHHASSSSVNEFGFSTSNGETIYDVVGNVWQWSRTPMRALSGFRVHQAYDDFSTPTFDEKHALILGSSWASSGNLIMKNSRYAFRKHFYQNAGFRYVHTKKEEENLLDIYESDTLVAQYCEFQYGETHFGVENFSISTAKIASNFALHKTKALDLGCATGRATFELAKEFESVEGIDFSVRFVQVGAKLKSDGYIAFNSQEEGELTQNKKVTVEDLDYENLKEKVSFWQGDACNLKPHFKEYDLIMATNLIDRLYNPKLFLETIDERLNSEGILVITSPYTWQESSTKKEFWLGGYKDKNGDEVKTIESLKKILDAKFELLHIKDVPFVIKETQRKYQHTISELSVWKKK